MNRKRISKENKGQGLGKVFGILITFGIIGVSALLFVNSARSIMTAYNRSLLLDQAHDEVAELRLKNLELLEKKEGVLDDSYVEQEARDRISYVRDGEKIVVLPETGEEVVLGADDEMEEENNGLSDWRRWWDLLKNGV